MVRIKRYTAKWCQPCRMIAPVFEALQKEYPQIYFETIDIDQNKDAIYTDNITSVPTVIIEKDNKEISRINGVRNKKYYSDIISNL